MEIGLVVLLIVAVGGALIYIARIARHKHEQMRRAGIDQFELSRFRDARSSGEWLKLQFFGPQPKFFEALGPVLAVGVIAFVVVVVVGVAAAILLVSMWQ